MQLSPQRPLYRVHGMMQSYFTRKMTAYFDYKGIPWLFRRFPGVSAASASAGFPGGVPVVETPAGEFMWDSTPMLHHLEHLFPEPSVIPVDPVQRFLCYVVEDIADEWLYRVAVGSRWYFGENHGVGGFELARDISVRMPTTCDQAYSGVGAHVRSSCGPLGVNEGNIQTWIDEVLRPWLRGLGAHLAQRPFLFGDRPSLADFALFGGNAAHFINDPLCRRWTDEDAPSVVQHTHRLFEPEDEAFGGWTDDCPDSLIALLADAGRLYLPWVSRACVDGTADIRFANGTSVTIQATEFLRHARAVLLGRYVALRSDALDATLARAGILPYFAPYVGMASDIPDATQLPQPRLNRPFPPAGE